jgi:hypothetical protein
MTDQRTLKKIIIEQRAVINTQHLQMEAAREYADRALVEHNVSYEFVENYGKKLDPEHTTEWVSTAYLKELREILIPRKEEDSVELLRRYRSEYAEQGLENCENKEQEQK